MKKIFKIKGMHCNNCATLIENALKDKINKISVSFSKSEAEIDFDESKISEKEIKKIIEDTGYEVTEEKEENKQKKNKSNSIIGYIFLIGAIILLLFVLYKTVGGINVKIPDLGEKTSLVLLFLAGILTGFHCISMCGGFVVSYTAKNALKGHKSFKQHLVYGGSKVVSYTIMGGIFGLIGGIFAFSVKLRGTVAILAGIFMVLYALGMMGFGFFKRFQLNPKFLMKATSKASQEAKGPYKAPLITGLLNGLFIACGPLQAMYLYAAGSGSIISGATGLAAFGLGTLPVMLGFGSFATVISHKTTRKILKVSAVIVLILGIIMLNRGLTVMGSPLSYDSIKSKVLGANSVTGGSNSVLTNGVQEITMNVDASGYSPNSFVIKKGVPVKWNVNVQQLTSCNSELIVNAYGINKNLQTGLNVIEFTPDKTGTIQFNCGMGMLHGTFIVTEDGTATQNQVKSATPSKGMNCNMGSSGGCGCGM
jgi:uncharacterized protein